MENTGRVRRGAGGAGAAESVAVVEKAMSTIESFKSTVTDLNGPRCPTSRSRRSTTPEERGEQPQEGEKPTKEKVELKDTRPTLCVCHGVI
jgi:hypothetical protein